MLCPWPFWETSISGDPSWVTSWLLLWCKWCGSIKLLDLLDTILCIILGAIEIMIWMESSSSLFKYRFKFLLTLELISYLMFWTRDSIVSPISMPSGKNYCWSMSSDLVLFWELLMKKVSLILSNPRVKRSFGNSPGFSSNHTSVAGGSPVMSLNDFGLQALNYPSGPTMTDWECLLVRTWV